MKYGIDKNVRLTIRISPDQWDFLTFMSRSLHMSKSDFIRFLINYHIAEKEKRHAN